MIGFGYALPALPLLAGLLGLLLPVPPARPAGADRVAVALHDGVVRARARLAAALGVTATLAALVCAVVLAAGVTGDLQHRLRWLRIGPLTVGLDLWLTPAAALVAVAVTVVALCVQVYSVGYLRGDDRYPPYAAQVSLFTGAMLVVVVAGDFIPLLVGWEVMGACSYLLIAHDRGLPTAPAAAVKAFLVTRFGDAGFLLGIVLLAVRAGSFRLSDVLAHSYDTTTLTLAGLLLLAGVAGKSAQFPLHTWLPDAMAGPTPISALIHAATMVAAGVYVLTRLAPLLAAAPVVLAVLGIVGVITLLLGALAATAQSDLKRVLAWSTVSQLGYMTGALAVGAAGAALFHLLTHAAFKALLFLGAGAVIHALDRNDMVGGLRRRMPHTFVAMLLGVGALIGIPPLSGFWSKEAVLHAAAHTAGPAWLGNLVWVAGVLGVGLTAWYGARLMLLTFAGPARPAVEVAHDPPWLLRAPILVLLVPTVALGALVFSGWFRGALGLPDLELTGGLLPPLALAVLGVGAAWWRWRSGSALAGSALAATGFEVDAAQRLLVVRPVQALAQATRLADEVGVAGAATGVGGGVLRLADRVRAVHRGPLPRALTFGLGGTLLAAVVIAVVGVW